MSAQTSSTGHTLGQREQALTDFSVDVGSDYLPSCLATLLVTAAAEIDRHTNQDGHCAVCLGEPYPCERAQLAEHNLAAL